MGSLTCAQLWVRAVHTNGGSGTNKLTRRDRKTVVHLVPPRGWNLASADFSSESLTTELRPPSKCQVGHSQLLIPAESAVKELYFDTSFKTVHYTPRSGDGL